MNAMDLPVGSLRADSFSKRLSFITDNLQRAIRGDAGVVATANWDAYIRLVS